MTDPREDALAKAREALALGRRWTTEHLGNCSEDDTPDEVSKIKEDLADIDDAIASLAALSAPPSQSESDDERAKKAFDLGRQYERAFAKLSPTPYVRPAALSDLWRDLCEKDDRTSPEEYPDMALITFEELCAIVAAANEVRPAAEIRAEIEQAKRPHDHQNYGLSLKLEGYIAGLTFALTPPTEAGK